LTEKKGVFWGCFAEKRGWARKKITLFFAFSPFFANFAAASRCASGGSGGGRAAKKIVPKTLP
jgi:hypothetical protein